MRKSIITKTLLFLLFLSASSLAQQKEVIAYFAGGAVQHGYYVKNIETSGSAGKITVLNYAFCVPAPDSTGAILPVIDVNTAYGQVYDSKMSIDGIADDSNQVLRGSFNQLKKLKAKYPHIKMLISIGGWGGSNYFSDAALTSESRERFAEAVIDIYIRGNLPKVGSAGGDGSAAGLFEGIDIDWEYPIFGGTEESHYNEKDNDNLSELVKIFREKLDAINPDFLLTSAIPGTMPYAANYNLKRDEPYMDWYNVMTYDFTNGFSTVINHHTNLLTPENDTTGTGAYFSMDYSVKLFRDTFGISPAKIAPGAAFYGRGWTVKDTAFNGIGQKGIKGLGYNSYSSLSNFGPHGYISHWDNKAMAPYYFDAETKAFWTYDDAQSMALKARYVDAYKLRGLMFWDISGDDSLGTLVNTIYTREMPEPEGNQKDTSAFTPGLKINLASSQIKSGSNVIIYANVNGSSTGIAKIEFFVDGKSIGYDTKAPYSWVWFNTESGEHTISAEAVSYSGIKRFSNIIPVKVK